MPSQINLFFRKPFYRQISKIIFVWLYAGRLNASGASKLLKESFFVTDTAEGGLYATVTVPSCTVFTVPIFDRAVAPAPPLVVVHVFMVAINVPLSAPSSFKSSRRSLPI
ncbi:hypothetical protein KsCSTR_27110 [Candidatus Kuenenia stuttgartiensis]|uniref:Uncharacterized protein n=1 Tax=Kuenenia stuttgartiensis TaxID=174633 RepID=A0A2C9CL51_KUEST|nr:hypothetical protein KsCSTR_27110 [Candidatus Kuenenia stuttgartiensis]SOH06376.1 hypothetical protein KSMBR1_3904 [Candidatus Kuenenia stuttgartiensis]